MHRCLCSPYVTRDPSIHRTQTDASNLHNLANDYVADVGACVEQQLLVASV